ncbi:hypothetical protein Dxin01_00132 [Deinococcus xinjiangensis]|uniref:Uncharacterized protein n=1 Tax=Deinococcus xinjiangensis TaxID=457454 RepID=A0ABP9V6U3_9DEIO
MSAREGVVVALLGALFALVILALQSLGIGVVLYIIALMFKFISGVVVWDFLKCLAFAVIIRLVMLILY